MDKKSLVVESLGPVEACFWLQSCSQFLHYYHHHHSTWHAGPFASQILNDFPKRCPWRAAPCCLNSKRAVQFQSGSLLWERTDPHTEACLFRPLFHVFASILAGSWEVDDIYKKKLVAMLLYHMFATIQMMLVSHMNSFLRYHVGLHVDPRTMLAHPRATTCVLCIGSSIRSHKAIHSSGDSSERVSIDVLAV